MSIIKNDKDIEKIKKIGKLAAKVLEMIEQYVIPGVTTNKLNYICNEYITKKLQAFPSPLHYNGFPKSICTSINEQVCHGIPSNRKLKNGDIINIDITLNKNGMHADTSKMFSVGKNINKKNKKLLKISQECLYLAIKEVKPGKTLGNIGATIQKHAYNNNYSVVYEYCGHGIGKNFHESPQVLHYGIEDSNLLLEEGMVFTIEPMINEGSHEVEKLTDKWTIITKDKKFSAQWEHTILVTKNGYEILTFRKEEINKIIKKLNFY